MSLFESCNFKKENSFEIRKKESARIINKYPDRIPIIVTRSSNSNVIPDIDKHKYLVPKDLTVGQFMYVIRKRIKLDPDKGIYIFINTKIPPTSQLISDLFNNNKDQDGFLYLTYSGESTFG